MSEVAYKGAAPIIIHRNDENSADPQSSLAQNQYQEWVARFCYASAKLPPRTVEHMLDLMETCGDSNETGLPFKEGNA